MRTSMESITMNQTNDIARVMAEHPELGYDRWRIEPDDREFAERRRELSEAAAALDLCRRRSGINGSGNSTRADNRTTA